MSLWQEHPASGIQNALTDECPRAAGLSREDQGPWLSSLERQLPADGFGIDRDVAAFDFDLGERVCSDGSAVLLRVVW